MIWKRKNTQRSSTGYSTRTLLSILCSKIRAHPKKQMTHKSATENALQAVSNKECASSCSRLYRINLSRMRNSRMNNNFFSLLPTIRALLGLTMVVMMAIVANNHNSQAFSPAVSSSCGSQNHHQHLLLLGRFPGGHHKAVNKNNPMWKYRYTTTSSSLHSKLTKERRQQLGVGEDEDEYDLYKALETNTDPLISKIIAGSFILVMIALLVVGVVIPLTTDYGDGVCNPVLNGGRC